MLSPAVSVLTQRVDAGGFMLLYDCLPMEAGLLIVEEAKKLL